MIQYLAVVAGTSGTTQGQLEKQILLTNPLLEAFGNAKTIRNNNSSRFGKFIRIEFASDGKIVGCHIENYLLEKSRVIRRADNERSFHIFYQLLDGATAQQKTDFLLETPRQYRYLKGEANIDGVDNKKEFEETLSAMQVIGFTDAERDQLWSILSGILHFGNMEFVGSKREDSAQIKNVETADKVSHLFGIKSADLQRCLLKPRVKAGREWVTAMVTADKAEYSVEALCKSMYERMFKWIVSRINSTLETHGRVSTFIGCLDIAGFEIFDHNSFEQLCINLTNEKLQQFFNNHMFVLEQEEYIREGIEWKFVDFGLDLQPTIDLIEKPLGILSILDEECLFPKASDKSFIEKLHAQQDGKHEKYHKIRLNPDMFLLDHYAGSVPYETANWLDKNKDPINDNVASLLSKSTNPLIANLFEDAVSEEDGSVKARAGKASTFITVAQRHRQQLNALMTTLRATVPHFVRCIIPNEQKKAGIIDAPLVLDQLRCNGVLEGIRIVRMGFPSRLPFAEFKQRYEILAVGVIPKGFMDGKVAAVKLLESLAIAKDNFRIGNSKVFFKAGAIAELEERRDERLSQLISGFQAASRGYLARRRFRRQHGKEEAINVIQKNARVFIELYQWSWWKLYRQVKPLLGVHRTEQEQKKLTDRIKELEAALKSEEALRAELEAKVATLAKEHETSLTDLATEREALEETVQSLKNLEEKRAKLQAMLKDNEKLLEEADEENARIDSTNKRLQEEIKGLNAKLADDTEKRAAMEEVRKQNQVELEQARNMFNAEKEKLSGDLENERRKREQAVAELRGQLEAAQSSLERARKEAKNASANNDEMSASLAAAEQGKQSAETARRNLERDLQDAQNELRVANAKRQLLEDSKKELDDKIAAMNQRLDEAEASKAAVGQAKASLEEELEEMQKQVSDANKARAAADQQRKSVETQLGDADTRLRAEEARRKEAEIKVSTLEAQLEDATDKLNRAVAASDNSLLEALRAERAKNAALEEKIRSETARRLAAEERYAQEQARNQDVDERVRQIREILLR